MPTFYSPKNNPEVWESKPEGYLTVSEWMADHAPPPPTPEEEDEAIRQGNIAEKRFQLAALDAQYLTVRVLGGLATGDAFALGQWETHEELAGPIREQLAALLGPPSTDPE
jgi:hypothetical protein